jgi:hypothetical protein
VSDNGTHPATAPLSSESANGHTQIAHVSGNGGVTHANRPAALIGVPIRSRDRKVREIVVAMFRDCEWLTAPDAPAATRLAHLYRKIERLGADLESRGMFKADGDPRKAIGEWRQLMAEARAHESALGLTASSRAALGVDIGRIRKLNNPTANEPDTDVLDLERRYLESMGNGG